MKGISHFAVGVAVASCFPAAVRAGADGNPLYFILGGVLGLLPDTLDFKFQRFFYRHDIEVIPDPKNPDPQMIADAVAGAVARAHATGKPVRIKLDTIRLGTDLWQQYSVAFQIPQRRVAVKYGPVVDMSGTPGPQTGAGRELKAEAALPCEVKLDYQARTTIDILDGPLFQMVPAGGRVIPRFLPWHRQWTHSLIIALMLALTGTLLWDMTAGLVIAAAYAAHILLDQLGFMGSNVFFPFGSKRTHGMRLMHSVEALPNLATVWLACLLIFWNVYRSSPWKVPNFSLAKLVFYGVAVPAGVIALLRLPSRHARDRCNANRRGKGSCLDAVKVDE